MESMDTDKSGVIEIGEFKTWWAVRLCIKMKILQ